MSKRRDVLLHVAGDEIRSSTRLKIKIASLYDQFFKATNKKEIIAHEFSHLHYEKWNKKDLEEFARLSGWTYKRENEKIVDFPPEKLIQADSDLDKEEDFSNYFGLFMTTPEVVKNHNPKVYEFFNKRFKK
ncbi:MAG: hypothetical protein QE271_05570 [Bacteriovoracaceae bacterium]|nr:hypothetical protein [Bacteriovoracaceae bacterium]